VPKNMSGLRSVQQCSQSSPGTTESQRPSTQNQYTYLKKLFNAAGTRLPSTMAGLALVQRTIQPSPATRKPQSNAPAKRPAKPRAPKTFVSGPFGGNAGYPVKPSLQGEYRRQQASWHSPHGFQSLPISMQPPFRDRTNTALTFTSLQPNTVLSAVPPIGPTAPLVRSVGSRDSQQYLHQRDIQQYAQRYAQVYAEQYTMEYARRLAEQQQLIPTPQRAAVLPAFQPLPAVSETFNPPRVYTHTPTGPKLENLNLHTPKRTPISPLAQVAAQVANRPQGTTFHFALSGQ
jgi:hypothetical protein